MFFLFFVYFIVLLSCNILYLMESLLRNLKEHYGLSFLPEEEKHLLSLHLTEQEKQNVTQVIDIVVSEMGLSKVSVLGVLLRGIDSRDLRNIYDGQVVAIVEGLHRVDELYRKNNTSLETENFRKLLLSLAQDVRVVLIIIADRLALMRQLNASPDSDYRRNVARETAFLYAPLAHRLGLYAVKTELEDLSLKYTDYVTYKDIAHTLNETKRHRDAYIAAFIAPLKEKLEKLGYKFTIKGRTKSIHSIYKKMQKQNTTVDHIYDLFAIRIILDSAPEKEKAECWQVYSVIADMYQPNPKRLRDWLTIPKSNGYESLHTTVLGPENKWVEVQIRTRRMDEIAEKGVAAHWKYKGIKAETGMDEFLKGVREILENPNVETKDAINDFRLNFYEQEVFVFTPNGDLYKLPKGATILDFAFSIHTSLGCHCVGGKIGGRNVPIKYALRNGDQVEILTSPQQRPSQAWLQIVCTSKARNKIRQMLKEIENKDAADGKELLERRFRNWKLDYDEGIVSRLAKKLGYKAVTLFYQALAQGTIDMLGIKEQYLELAHADSLQEPPAVVSAENYVVAQPPVENTARDELVIDRDLKNIDYKLAKCCNPIFGDEIFGFVSVTSGIKIHRKNCPNAGQMKERFPYRIVPARWSGKAVGQQYPITLRVVGNDDIGIVTNITSLINKENGMALRAISIDSHDGLFEGHLTLLVNDLNQLEQIRKKISQVKGVKNVIRG